ncbi:PMD domain-containing protein [Cephalotus follicularis]|uniref:PMD domain-containing protein n=1 Tax=Cephalotus follicularis TaxID=3775 RepID=A0A1Q3BIH3_CEPFO|nr:PMD domain-containing protein [Cephalotus follicularis]
MATFSSWIKYHFGSAIDEKKGLLDFEEDKDFDPKLNLAAFVTFWLSMYLFSGLPVDDVNRSLFMLSIKISKGEIFSLAPSFVDSLYKRLDLYKRSMEASLGRNCMLYFVDTAALQLFLWDHYRGYAPKVGNRKVAIRAWLRYTSKPLTNLLDFLYEESEFDFCPYTHDTSSP